MLIAFLLLAPQISELPTHFIQDLKCLVEAPANGRIVRFHGKLIRSLSRELGKSSKRPDELRPAWVRLPPRPSLDLDGSHSGHRATRSLARSTSSDIPIHAGRSDRTWARTSDIRAEG
jgi:hypothetical protein